jgi:hypothetical protein
MAVGYAIERILSAGTVSALTTQIYDGQLPQQATYPAVQIDDFSESEACKEGEGSEFFTVTIMAHGERKNALEAIIDAAKTDLINYVGDIGETTIKGIRFNGRGPWFKDKETQLWVRPADFLVSV